MAPTHSAAILFQRFVAGVMQFVLDSPMRPGLFQDSLRVCLPPGLAGDSVHHFHRRDPLERALPRKPEGLADLGPVEVVVQPSRGGECSDLDSTVPLGPRRDRLGVLKPAKLLQGGKGRPIRRRRRWRRCPRAKPFGCPWRAARNRPAFPAPFRRSRGG